VVLLPSESGIAAAVLGLGDAADPRAYSALPAALPAGAWRLADDSTDQANAAFYYALGAYRFGSLKQTTPPRPPLLRMPDAPGLPAALRAAQTTWLVRDLINTPANLLGPAELAACARSILVQRGAHADVITGELLVLSYPAIAEVGRGSVKAPHVVVASWRSATASESAPLISICGKGVCFDTGGYDIKPSAGMLRMKKDMGGAAIALGLACMVIDADLPIRLELRLGCVENMISGDAMRPSDVVRTRAGLHVEVGNTDAEGRLVLCDLIAEACESKPAMLLDFATLTGAARTALGPDLPAMFTNDDGLAEAFLQSGRLAHDPVWRLPLHDGYNSWLDSVVADLNNVSDKSFAGAIVAALFLQRFVSVGTKWVHFDVYAWNDMGRCGFPPGGEAQTLRAAFGGVSDFAHRRVI
jgi:leucyl aminopeptidase